MKTRSGIALVSILTFMLFISAVNAQTMYFCEGVDEDGYPINEATSFTIPPDGGYLYVLIRLPYEVDCKSVRFVIYRNGDYDNTIYVDTEYNWSWFWKKITFYKRGTYDIYAYDCYDYELAYDVLRINYE
ncbi:MAG: hypothetical protein HXY48_07300 [Ignavibacteriaceae bacterium]|jgi:hypothetical protein|nr:hypothetical protein [Ignavibacteriaceae bacterium]